MSRKNNTSIFWLVALFIATAYAYAWFSKQPSFLQFIEYSQNNVQGYFIILILIKITAIVIPPIPGRVFTVASIPVIGWWGAYLADLIGGVIGDIATFLLGRKYGYALLDKLFDKKTVARAKKIKIQKNKELEAMIVLNTLYGTVSEVISYSAGLLGVRLRNFAAASLIVGIINIPIFYLAEIVLKGQSLLVATLVIALTFAFFYKIKGRYFH